MAKNNSLNVFLLALIVFSSISISSYSQYYSEGYGFLNNFKINASYGTSLIYGDMQRHEIFPYSEDVKFGFAAGLQKQFNPVFGLGFQYLMGDVQGVMKKYPNGGGMANLIYQGNYTGFNLHANIDLSNGLGGYQPERKFSAIGTLGIGFTNWAGSVRDYNNGQKVTDHLNIPENPIERSSQLTVPVGLGVNYNINQNFGINLSTTFHAVYNDLFDAYEYGFNIDFLNYTSLGITYSFSKFGSNEKREKSAKVDEKASYEVMAASDPKAADKEYQKELKEWEKQMKEDEKQRNRSDKQVYEEMKEQQYQNTNPDRSTQKEIDKTLLALPVVANYDVNKKISDDTIYMSRQGIISSEELNMEANEKTKESEEILRTESKLIISGGALGTGINNAQQPAKKETIDDYNARLAQILKEDAENKKSGVVIRDQGTMKPTGGTITTTQPATNYANRNYEPASGVQYRVQILARNNGKANINQLKSSYNVDQQIFEDASGGWFRYSAGSFSNYNAAAAYRNQLQSNGATGAFVVAYRNGVRISLSEAAGR